MKYQLLFLLFTAVFTCNDSQESLFGEYRTSMPTQFEQGVNKFLFNQSKVTGSELILKKDSSFSYSTCGNIFKRKWKSKKDTLLLFIESNQWANDSLSQYGLYGEKLEVSNEPMKFEIIKHDFRQKSFVKVEGKLLRVIEELERVED